MDTHFWVASLARARLATDLVLWHLRRHWIWLGESGRLYHHVDAHHVCGSSGTYDDRGLAKAPTRITIVICAMATGYWLVVCCLAGRVRHHLLLWGSLFAVKQGIMTL